MRIVPVALIAASVSMVAGQLWKIFSHLLRGRKLKLRAVAQAGGMPSSHTAAVASLTLVVGFREGFHSSVFAVALVLTGVVAHDAVNVRGSMNTIVSILRHTAPAQVREQGKALPDRIGHSVIEVVAGFLLAAVVAPACHFLLP